MTTFNNKIKFYNHRSLIIAEWNKIIPYCVNLSLIWWCFKELMSREVRNSIFGIYQITTLLINLPIFANLIWQIDVFFIWNKRINKFYDLLIKFSCKNNKLNALSLNFIFASIILSGIIIKYYYLNLLNSKLSFIWNKSYITNH